MPQNYPFPNSFPTFYTDLGVNTQNPGVGFGGTETGALYFEDREVNGIMYRVQNATWNKVAQKWLLIDNTKPAYGTALTSAGTWQFITSPAGVTPFSSWTVNWSVNSTGNSSFPTPQMFNVKDYGAKCDGVTDDTTAINAALTAAYAVSGPTTIIFPGVSAISSTISVGNGSFSQLSSYNAITLMGYGSGAGQLTSLQKSGLKWIGASGGTMLQLNGPIYGLALQGLLIDGNNGLANNGIVELNVAASSFRDVWVTNCIQVNWFRAGTASAAGGGNIGPAYNQYTNCGVAMNSTLNGASPSVPVIGLCLGGNPTNFYDYSPSTNATNWGAYEGRYDGFSVLMYGSDNSVGIDLRTCDHNYFDGGFIVAKSSVRCSPNSNSNGFPQGNCFTKADWQPNNKTSGAHITTNGTFVPSNSGDYNVVEFLDNALNYPGGNAAAWSAIPNWLVGRTGRGIFFGLNYPQRLPLYYVDRSGTSTVSNTTTLTAFSEVSYAVPGNTLNSTGALIRIKAAGTQATASGQIRLQVRLGSTVILDTLLVAPPASGAFQLEYEGVTKFGGATGRLVYNRSLYAFAGQSLTATNDSSTQSAAFDMTAAQSLSIVCGWSVANAGNTATLTGCSVEIEYPAQDTVS